LAYNDLTPSEFKHHVDDVVAFCELGPYLHRPIKTYSSGMKSRLFFAVASAVRPDILIIDEVLGAGDAYFGLKSAERIARLTGEGTTLLLVSHNLVQVRQMCERAVWIEQGELRATGATADIVAQYEEFTSELERANRPDHDAAPVNRWLERQITNVLMRLGAKRSPSTLEGADVRLEQPCGRPLGRATATVMSAWSTTLALEVPAATIEDLRPALAVFTEDGRFVDLLVGPALATLCGDPVRFKLAFEPMRFGPGNYILRPLAMTQKDNGQLKVVTVGARSAVLDVHSGDPTETALFVHPAVWHADAVDAQAAKGPGATVSGEPRSRRVREGIDAADRAC
jgi:hypothetical protein